MSKDLKRNLRPLGDRAAIKPVEQAEKTESGLFLPETAKDESQEGIVVAVGPGRTLEDGKVVPLAIKVGDRVLYAKYGGSKIKVDGSEVLIVSEKDVLAVVSDAPVAAGVN